MTAIWSPEDKIIMERQLWIAVMKAQQELGWRFLLAPFSATKKSLTMCTSIRSRKGKKSPATM